MLWFHSVPQITQVNGNLTLGENIADNGGLHTSYQAFLSLMNTTSQPMLPALKYTPEQLYFIAYGQVSACMVTCVHGYIHDEVSLASHIFQHVCDG